MTLARLWRQNLIVERVPPSMSYAWGCHGVEVEVDTQTGQVEIIR
jgi:CO/xanthine dehydrogenase Mo-binding subunit